MIRMIVITAAVLLGLGGVAFALTRPDIPDPGPAVSLDDTPGAPGRPLATPHAHPDGDRDDGDERIDAADDRDDDFRVVTPKAVKARGDDWDDDDRDDDRDDDDRDGDDRDGDDRDDDD